VGSSTCIFFLVSLPVCLSSYISFGSCLGLVSSNRYVLFVTHLVLILCVLADTEHINQCRFTRVAGSRLIEMTGIEDYIMDADYRPSYVVYYHHNSDIRVELRDRPYIR